MGGSPREEQIEEESVTSISTSRSARSSPVSTAKPCAVSISVPSAAAAVFRSFNLNGKLGVDATLQGDMRGLNSSSSGKPLIYIESNGRRFRCFGLRILIPAWSAARCGSGWTRRRWIIPRRMVVFSTCATSRSGARLRLIASSRRRAGRGTQQVEFSRMRVEFTRSLGRMSLRDGVVLGPIVGATIAGSIDYAANDVRLSGAFVPPLWPQQCLWPNSDCRRLVPWRREGRSVGHYVRRLSVAPSALRLRVNPISARCAGAASETL